MLVTSPGELAEPGLAKLATSVAPGPVPLPQLAPVAQLVLVVAAVHETSARTDASDVKIAAANIGADRLSMTIPLLQKACGDVLGLTRRYQCIVVCSNCGFTNLLVRAVSDIVWQARCTGCVRCRECDVGGLCFAVQCGIDPWSQYVQKYETSAVVDLAGADFWRGHHQHERVHLCGSRP